MLHLTFDLHLVILIYVVRPSYTSDTAIRIVRTQRTAQKLTHEKNARQSYSAEESDLHVAKRITSTCSESTVETLPCKKVKFDGLKETLNKAERMRKQRLALLAKKNENYFGEGFFKERKQKTNTHYRFPSEEQAAEQPSEN